MWNKLTIDVPDDLKDAVVGELSECGVAGVCDEDDTSSNKSKLVAYFAQPVDLDPVETRIRDIFERARCKPPLITQSQVEEQDWTEEWKKSYASFPIGDDFYIIPSWVDIACPEDRLPIRIDPGQAFGTGTHETTQLTMEALERWVERHHVVLDVGTGSGILAVASRLLGAHRVFACDIDPVAVHVATQNFSRNNERDILSFCGSVESVSTGSVEVLLANLTADVIQELFPEFSRIVKKSGLAVFSGILAEQREDIVNTCERFHFKIHEEITRGEWLVLVAENT